LTEPATARRPRADAQRNRERIIAAASEAFRELGLDASVAEIARRAGVGSGTLFRNFPTKQDLVRAIVEDRLTRWLDVANASLANPDPVAAFEAFVDEAVSFSYYDRGQMEAFKGGLLDEPELFECKCLAFDLTDKIVARAKEAGVLRENVSTMDLYSLAAGTAEATKAAESEGVETPEKPYAAYLAILLGGLRPPPTA
jgi:AcrR family transcriptional regulator